MKRKKNDFTTLTQVPSIDYAINAMGGLKPNLFTQFPDYGSEELSSYIKVLIKKSYLLSISITLTKDKNIYKISRPGPY